MTANSLYNNKRKASAAKPAAAKESPPRKPATTAPARLVNALTCDALAETIIHYWRHGLHNGTLDAQHALDIIDLMPGPGGAHGYMLLQALRRRLPHAGLPALRWRYLPVQSERALFREWLDTPEWQQAQREERMIPMLWNPEAGLPCLLDPAGRRAWNPANPAVLLAQEFLPAGQQRLFAAHYGKLLEAQLETLLAELNPDRNPWHPADPASLSPDLAATLQAMLPRFNSAPLCWPQRAMDMIERLTSLATRGCLLLATAHGDASEAALRLRSFAQVLDACRQVSRPPVSFALLEQYFRRRGAQLVATSSGVDGACLQAAALPPQGQAVAGAAENKGIASVILDPAWGRHAALLQAMRSLAGGGERMPLAAALALLQCAGCDPQVFSAAFPALIPAFQAQAQQDRRGWAQALQAVWSQHLPQEDSILHREVAAVAMRIAEWGFARTVLTRGMQALGRNASDLGYLAWCDLRTGRKVAARKLLEEALAIDGADKIAGEVHERMLQRVDQSGSPWRVTIAHPTLPLVLEPLDQSHAEALLHQYRDPQIAVMTGLQALNTLDETRKWITEHNQEAGRQPYAVMHHDHGLVGYVCLSNSAPSTYFCFWVGVDFQGRGWSGPLATLLCDFARSQGYRQFFTSIYDDNTRSIRSLARVGFRPLSLRALAPDNDRCFYYWCDPDVSEAAATAELVAYHVREKLPLRFPGMEAEPVLEAETAPGPA
ncbi:MAG: hypothetical protein JWP36_2319 [Paucimonas sp.]|nr:hypothetical protein [Paucimonas sp.]